MHIQTYSVIFTNYSGIFRTLCKAGIIRTLLHSEPCQIENWRHIQNSGIFRTLVYSELKAYSEPCQISNIKHFAKTVTAPIIFSNFNYFCNISFSCSPLYETNKNTDLEKSYTCVHNILKS